MVNLYRSLNAKLKVHNSQSRFQMCRQVLTLSVLKRLADAFNPTEKRLFLCSSIHLILNFKSHVSNWNFCEITCWKSLLPEIYLFFQKQESEWFLVNRFSCYSEGTIHHPQRNIYGMIQAIKYKVLDVTKFYFMFWMFRLMQQSFPRTRYWNYKFSKKCNIKKSYTTMLLFMLSNKIMTLLPVFCKIFEKLVDNRIVDHLKKCGLFLISSMVSGLLDRLQIFWHLYL